MIKDIPLSTLTVYEIKHTFFANMMDSVKKIKKRKK